MLTSLLAFGLILGWEKVLLVHLFDPLHPQLGLPPLNGSKLEESVDEASMKQPERGTSHQKEKKLSYL